MRMILHYIDECLAVTSTLGRGGVVRVVLFVDALGGQFTPTGRLTPEPPEPPVANFPALVNIDRLREGTECQDGEDADVDAGEGTYEEAGNRGRRMGSRLR
jgi:hypothetical protein